MVVDAHAVIAFTQFGQLVAGGLHAFLVAVDAHAVFHGHPHLVADGGGPLGTGAGIAGRVQPGQDAPFGVFSLLERGGVGLATAALGSHGGRTFTGQAAEDQQLGQRVGSQAVGAVDADAGALAGGEEPLDGGLAAAIGEDAAHGVVHGRADGDGILHRIDTGKGLGGLGNERQALVDLLLAQVAQVQVDGRAVRGVDGTTFLALMPEGLREPVTWAKLHGLRTRPGIQRAQAVVLQVAIAVAVDQDAAFAAAAFGHENAGARQAGGVVLHELHVAQRHAGPVGHAHAVAGEGAGVGVLPEHAACAARGHDHGIGKERQAFAAGDLDGQHATHAAVLDQQIGAEELVVAPDLRVLERGLEEGVQDVEAAAVGCEPGARHLHAAEVADVDVSVVLAAPGAAPLLQLDHLLSTVLDEIFDHVLFTEPVTTGDGVVEVVVQAVVGANDTCRAAFGHDGVRTHGNNLGDQRDLQSGIELGGRNGGAQSGTAAPEDDDVCRCCMHGAPCPVSDIVLHIIREDQRPRGMVGFVGLMGVKDCLLS